MQALFLWVTLMLTCGYTFGTVKIWFLESKIRKITSEIAESVAK